LCSCRSGKGKGGRRLAPKKEKTGSNNPILNEREGRRYPKIERKLELWGALILEKKALMQKWIAKKKKKNPSLRDKKDEAGPGRQTCSLQKKQREGDLRPLQKKRGACPSNGGEKEGGNRRRGLFVEPRQALHGGGEGKTTLDRRISIQRTGKKREWRVESPRRAPPGAANSLFLGRKRKRNSKGKPQSQGVQKGSPPLSGEEREKKGKRIMKRRKKEVVANFGPPRNGRYSCLEGNERRKPAILQCEKKTCLPPVKRKK